VIAISGTTRDDLVRHEGISPAKITVVHHGHGRHFQPAASAAIEMVRQRYTLAGPYLLFVGTLQPRKNLERLLAAFDRVAASEPSLTLVLVGAIGWQPERLTNALGALAARDRVKVLGFVDDADLPPLMSGALALAFPSLYEGFGLPALEAMACGTPVLTSTTSSMPEVVGDAGLLVDPLDVNAISAGLTRLVRDDALRAGLRQRGLARAATFTWERAARETLAVLRAAVATTRARSPHDGHEPR
jgi:glycosyltransferase involved in cell wall biosynthesis